MFTVPTTYIEYSGVLYKILRTVREDHRPIVENWKEYLNADMVLRKDRKSTRLNSSHVSESRMPSSA